MWISPFNKPRYGPGPEADNSKLRRIFNSHSNYIDVSNLNIKSLPPLPEGLLELDCHSTKITELPELPMTLKKLACYNTRITSLPPLPNTLEQLWCQTTHLTSLPPLPDGLRELTCYNNVQITSLPPLPEGLQELKCHNNLNLTTITGPCPLPLRNSSAFKSFYGCPNLQIQPEDGETCESFFNRFSKLTSQRLKRGVGSRSLVKPASNGMNEDPMEANFEGGSRKRLNRKDKTRRRKVPKRNTRKNNLLYNYRDE